MRVDNADELIDGYKSDDVDPNLHRWYIDQVILMCTRVCEHVIFECQERDVHADWNAEMKICDTLSNKI